MTVFESEPQDLMADKTIELFPELRLMFADMFPLLKLNGLLTPLTFNVIPDELDCWDEKVWENDALAVPIIGKKFRTIKHQGYFDAFRIINDKKIEWSFWDYQNGSWNKDYGIRIDHFLINSYAADIIKNCTIDKKPRGRKKPSDHTPIVLEF